MPRRPAAYLIVALACVVVGALVYAIAVGTRWGARARQRRARRVHRPRAAVARRRWPRRWCGSSTRGRTRCSARRWPRSRWRAEPARATRSWWRACSAARRSRRSCSSRCWRRRGRSRASPAPGSRTRRGRAGTRPGAMALALCLVLVAPRRLRPVAAACGRGVRGRRCRSRCCCSSRTSRATCSGGYCVACAWMALGLAALRATDARARRRPRRRAPCSCRPPWSRSLGGAVVAAAVLARPASAFSYAQRATRRSSPPRSALGAAGLVAVASAALALRREP